MPQFLKDISLKNYNTFGIEASAETFFEVINNQDVKDIMTYVKAQGVSPVILGGGSNILFTQSTYPLVIANKIKGITKVNENDKFVWVEAGAGEVWHDLVMYCIDQGWGGVENLSLIPGTVGAAPMQNIGAYGVEIKEVFESLNAVDMETFEDRRFANSECQFGYRESIFKKELKGKYFITSIVLKLSKKPRLNISYGAIAEVLKQNDISSPTIKDVSNAVIQIRQSKLPNPDEIGNAGSFFKNPVISMNDFIALKAKYPEMPSYEQPNGDVKVPAGWLIEQCGWKGSREGDIGVHKNQALVLVNYGGGEGDEIKHLAHRVKASVQEKFNISINPEVNII